MCQSDYWVGISLVDSCRVCMSFRPLAGFTVKSPIYAGAVHLERNGVLSLRIQQCVPKPRIPKDKVVVLGEFVNICSSYVSQKKGWLYLRNRQYLPKPCIPPKCCWLCMERKEMHQPVTASPRTDEVDECALKTVEIASRSTCSPSNMDHCDLVFDFVIICLFECSLV